MSVLKSILHHWNSTSKAYDTLHPETEVGQITDFGKGLLNQLAATTAQSVISALQTGSWFGQLLKLVLNASGVKYSIDTNGYVCLGSFFGGLIIQWVYVHTINAPYRTISFPIAFPNGVFICTATLCGYADDVTDACVIWNDGQTTRSMAQFRINGSTKGSPKCIAIGY